MRRGIRTPNISRTGPHIGSARTQTLKRDDGTKCTTDKEMREMAVVFYEQLFNSEGSMEDGGEQDGRPL